MDEEEREAYIDNVKAHFRIWYISGKNLKIIKSILLFNVRKFNFNLILLFHSHIF